MTEKEVVPKLGEGDLVAYGITNCVVRSVKFWPLVTIIGLDSGPKQVWAHDLILRSSRTSPDERPRILKDRVLYNTLTAFGGHCPECGDVSWIFRPKHVITCPECGASFKIDTENRTAYRLHSVPKTVEINGVSIEAETLRKALKVAVLISCGGRGILTPTEVKAVDDLRQVLKPMENEP